MKLTLTALFFCAAVFLYGCVAAIATGAAAGAATGVFVAHDRRSFNTVIDDQSIELKTSAALRNDEEIYKNSHINITSYNGIVLLTGETPSRELKTRAEELARAIPTVKRVYNELAILPPSSMRSRSRDSWITTKLKTKMAAEKNLDPTRVKVVTERGTVYLLGLVIPQEAELAVSIARHAKGVQRVVKIFEYLPQTALG
jgi:osmotically-inducible protein OsmY